MITQELFNRFLQNQCSEEERKEVMQYLAEHPEALERFLPQEEFLNIEPAEKADQELENRLLLKIRKQIHRPVVARLIVRRIAAAAIVLLIIGSVWKYFAFNKSYSGNAVNVNKVHVEKEQIQWKIFTAFASALHVIMPDSTYIDISPHSTMKYDSRYGLNGKRNVYLSGEAFFQVAKDKTRPFTVFSGAIATTALGTAFTIQALNNLNVISVQLHEGKVVVRPAEPGKSSSFTDTYLLPGDILFYNKATGKVSVRKAAGNIVRKEKGSLHTSGSIYKPNWYEFSQEPLSDVLDQLSYYYQVNIDYNKDAEELRFITARFKGTDSLDKILEDIAILNDLKIIKVGDKYILEEK